jgi:toxin ParE1/3/4
VSARSTVCWARTAVDDLLDVIDYVAGKDGTAAAHQLAELVTHEAATLATMPLRCRVVPELAAEGIDGYRELLVGPYRIVFALRDGDVIVLAVLDGRRDLAELLIARALRDRG